MENLLLCFLTVATFDLQESVGAARDSMVVKDDLEEEFLVEELTDGIESDTEESVLVDDILWLQENTYDLNTVTRTQLEALPGMTAAEADAVIRLRRQVRRFTAVPQLRAMEGGDEVFERIRRYVTVKGASGKAPSQGTPVLQMRTRAVRDLQPRRGFMDGDYAGSSLKSYNRLSVSPADWVHAGMLFEKDAGERTAEGFASGFVELKDVGGLGDVVVGDFNLEAGQGLVFWRGSAFGKGSEAASVAKKSGLGLRPHRSADEFYFLRGIAAQSSFALGAGRVAVTGIHSRRSLSATPESPDAIATFYDAGLFRTSGELARRNTVNEQLSGVHAGFSSEGWSAGVSYYHARLDKPVVAARTHAFTGARSDVGGVDVAWRFEGTRFFGEVARSSGNGLASIGGMTTRVGSGTDVALVYRDYSPEFYNRYARGFGESGNTRNERGFYLGVSSRVNAWLRVSGYLDHFRYPWRTFSVPLPVTGHDVLVQSELKPLRKLHVLTRFAHKKTGSTGITVDDLSRNIRPVIPRSQYKGRVTVTYQVSPALRVKGRLEGTSIRYPLLPSHERGFLLFQDVHFRPQDRFAIETRLVFFDTQSFDSRIYEYENDIRGVFANPALFGKGRRWYVLVRYKPVDALALSVKYAETQKDGVTSMGSGMSEIIGDLDNRLAMQLDVQF